MAGKRKMEYISKDFVLFLLEYYGNMLTWSKEDVLSEIKRKVEAETPIVLPATFNCKEGKGVIQ